MSQRKTQGERLRAAIRDAKISRRRLALLTLGDDASEERIASRKSQITKWLGGKHGIGDLNALELAQAFNRVQPGRYEETYFFKDPDPQPSWAEEVARLAAQRQRDQRAYQEEIRRLREELEITRQEMLYELDRLKEAS